MANRFVLVSLVILGGFTSLASAEEWGDLKVKFTIDGAAPQPRALVINKDEQVCGKHGLVDEGLVVNASNGAIANVVVYLYVARGGKKPPVHADYKASEKSQVICDNDKCRFEPHITAVRTTQTLVAGNKDAVGHNMNVATLKNPAKNVLIPAGGQLKLDLTQEESLPSPISCNIHPWMKGYLVVKEHPYVGISDKDGNVTIKNVPAGKWAFQVWQETVGFVVDVKQDGKATKWERGRVDVTIKAGANDLGEVKIPVSAFEKK